MSFRTASGLSCSTTWAAVEVKTNINGAEAPLQTGLDYVIDHAELDVSSGASSVASLTWKLAKDNTGTKLISDENTDSIRFISGSTAIGCVVRGGPIRFRLSSGEGLFLVAKTNTGACTVTPKVTLHRPTEGQS